MSLSLLLCHGVSFLCFYFTVPNPFYSSSSSCLSSFCNSCTCFTHPSLPILAFYKSSHHFLCPCLSSSHPYFSYKLLSPSILFWSHLELVAACHPIIADHPDNVSVSHSSQMIMTLPSCSVTRDTLGSANLRSGRCVCVPMHVYFNACVNVFVQILYAQKGSREKDSLLVLICVMCANASMCALNLLNWRCVCDVCA